jgi:hypothetical protein
VFDETGQQGIPGVPGIQGAPGVPGPTGPAGPLTRTLPSGATLRGAFNIDDVATTSTSFSEQGISFGFAVASPPAIQIVSLGGTTTAQCPGSPQRRGARVPVRPRE